jgi:4-diphosphocytidyl-2-C-methyl-D-erythritol kinase
LTLALPARAKLNLDLEVLGVRDDGFHEVRTTLQAIDLHDLITLQPAVATELTISGLDVTSARQNSVLAAHALLERASGRALPTRMHLYKRIPPGSGLGGASSDAATTLRGLAYLYNITIDLTSLASSLGADVPFFLHGGTALAEGRGDRLTPIPTEDRWFAIAWPSLELRTPDVYRAWDGTPGGGPPNHLALAAMRIEPRLKEFANALNSPAGEAGEAREAGTGEAGTREAGQAWQMTGSGSAFFRRCASEDEAKQKTRSLDCWTALAHTVRAW